MNRQSGISTHGGKREMLADDPFRTRWVRLVMMALACLVGMLSWAPATLSADADTEPGLRIPREGGRGEMFLAGFYVYPHLMRHVADRKGIDYRSYLDRWLNMVTGKGFNLFYVATGPNIDDWIHLSEKYHFKIIVQLDFAYLTRPELGDVYAKAPAAVKFIKKYKDHPNVFAFSIKEEPRPEFMAPLHEYYRRIKAEAPDARMHLLLNWRDTIGKLSLEPPAIIATDRYAFWGWDSSAGGYAATPRSALAWYRSDMEPYARYARESGAHFQAVFTTVVNVHVIREDDLQTGAYGNHSRILQLARSENQGWSALPGGRVKYTKYYRPPPNCTRAMVWLSILNGARSVLHWSGNPTDPLQEAALAEQLYRIESVNAANKYVGQEFSLQMFDTSIASTPAFGEYVETITELQDFGWFINRMQMKEGNEQVSLSSDKVHAKVFDLAGHRGKILVLVNVDVGTWGKDSVASLVGRNDVFPIDSVGHLRSFVPHTTPKVTTVRMGLPGDVLDIKTGRTLGPAANATVTIQPGSGRFLYVGDESELRTLRKTAGLVTTD